MAQVAKNTPCDSDTQQWLTSLVSTWAKQVFDRMSLDHEEELIKRKPASYYSNRMK